MRRRLIGAFSLTREDNQEMWRTRFANAGTRIEKIREARLSNDQRVYGWGERLIKAEIGGRGTEAHKWKNARGSGLTLSAQVPWTKRARARPTACPTASSIPTDSRRSVVCATAVGLFFA